MRYAADVNAPKPFKRVPKRFAPKGLSILYEDHDLVVVDKASGLLTVGHGQSRERTAYDVLTDYVGKGNPKSTKRVFLVHRLDKFTSGVLVMAKHEKAKDTLQADWENVRKTYHAVVHGVMPNAEGVITSYLAESSTYRMYSVTDPTMGRLSHTAYRVLKEGGPYSLLEIDLMTGRKNQIRVHCADVGCPVAGDTKYGKELGKRVTRLMLHSSVLRFAHPFTKEPMTFTATLPACFGLLFKGRRPSRGPSR